MDDGSFQKFRVPPPPASSRESCADFSSLVSLRYLLASLTPHLLHNFHTYLTHTYSDTRAPMEPMDIDDFQSASDAFLTWLKNNGATISSSVQLADLRGRAAGRGVGMEDFCPMA